MVNATPLPSPELKELFLEAVMEEHSSTGRASSGCVTLCGILDLLKARLAH